MKAADLTAGDSVTAARDGRGGPGVILQIKAGNWRDQDYKVQHLTGEVRWYSLSQIAQLPDLHQKPATRNKAA